MGWLNIPLKDDWTEPLTLFHWKENQANEWTSKQMKNKQTNMKNTPPTHPQEKNNKNKPNQPIRTTKVKNIFLKKANKETTRITLSIFRFFSHFEENIYLFH